MEAFIFLSLSLIFDISFNCVSISVWSNCGNIIPICPKLSRPEILFEEISIFLENPFCGDAFNCLSNLFWWLHRNWLNEKVNMIQICSNLVKSNFKRSWLNFFNTYSSKFFIKFGKSEDFFPILYWTHKMIQAKIYVVWFVNVRDFHTENSYLLTQVTILRNNRNQSGA